MEWPEGYGRPNPWRRMPIWPSRRCLIMRKTHTFDEGFKGRSRQNLELDIDAKSRAVRVSPSIVSLVSHKGDKKLFVASGTIIDCEDGDVDGGFTCTILTCATLLRGRFEEEALSLDDVKVVAYVSDDISWEAEVYRCDSHFNICLLKIRTNEPQRAVVTHSHHLSIVPGEKVIALGRHHITLDLMAAPGVLCSDRCKLDCDELCTASCKISLGGIGGPIINFDGKVIGINFYDASFTPFLPLNIVSRCLELFKNSRCIPRYQLGLQVVRLGEVSESLLELIVRKFPNIREGIVIEKVLLGSLAESAGIHPCDIIVECQKKPVRCPVEFFGMMLDMAGKEVEIVVMRPSNGNLLKLKVVADLTSTKDIYRWPIPEPRLCEVEY